MLLNALSLQMLPPKAIVLAQNVILLSAAGSDPVEKRFLGNQLPPFGTVSLSSAAGPVQITATRWRDDGVWDEEIDDLDHPASAPVVIGSDIVLLADELDLPSRRRLLAFLVGFCRKAFDLGENAAFAVACLRLAHLCTTDAGQATHVAKVSEGWTVLRGPDCRGDNPLYALSAARVRRLTAVAIPSNPPVLAVEALRPGEQLLLLNDPPELWSVTASAAGLVDLVLPCPQMEELRRLCLRALAPLSPSLAACLREQALLSPSAPLRADKPQSPLGAALDVALPDGEGRLFLRGWIRDPMHLVASAELQTPFGGQKLDLADLHRFQRPEITQRFATSPFMSGDNRFGFVAYVADPSAGLHPQPSLVLRLHSGARMLLRAPLLAPSPTAAREAVLTSIRSVEVDDRVLDACLAPAAAAFHRRALDVTSAPDVIRIGPQASNPAVSIIIPLYRNLSFLRFQFGAFAVDPACRAAQLIVALDSPEQRDEVEHLLRGLHATHDLSCLLVVLPRNLGYAAANNLAATHVTGSALLLLNSDVIPSTTPWLQNLLAALDQPGVGVAGPKLLFDDESIQHAGLFFRQDAEGVWYNAHYDKGMPRHTPSASVTRETPGVTGAALLVRRALFEDVGGICQDYIIGDYEDSDFCLKAREHGAAIQYVAGSELYHFERKSIGLHKGYTGTLACKLNRRLHHLRWHGAIADLMRRPEFQPGATP